MAKCLLLCSSSNSCPSINPQRDSFPVQHSGHFHNTDVQRSSVLYGRQFIWGTDNQPHALALPPTFIWEPQSGVAHPGTCWETQALGCGRKAGGTTRINNSASTRKPKVHSVQSHPERFGNLLTGTCLQTAHQLLHVRYLKHNAVAQPYSDTGVIKTPSPLTHSLQNTFFSSNNRAKHVSVWTSHSVRDLLM